MGDGEEGPTLKRMVFNLVVEGGHDFIVISISLVPVLATCIGIAKRRQQIIPVLHKYLHPAGQSHPLLKSFVWVYN